MVKIEVDTDRIEARAEYLANAHGTDPNDTDAWHEALGQAYSEWVDADLFLDAYQITTAEAGESYTYTYGPFDNPDEQEIILGAEIDGYGTRILGILVDKDDACFGWVTSETEPASQAIADSHRVVALDTHEEQVRNMFTT